MSPMDKIVNLRTISHSVALDAVVAAIAYGATQQCPVAAAVMGAGGELVAFARANGAPFHSTLIAQDKALTAASFKVPTPELHRMVSDNDALRAGITARPGIVLFGGGLPIFVDDECIGGIGISGGSEAIDIECANAGLLALGAKQFS